MGRFEAALAYGQEGERAVALWLIARGLVVAPLYQFSNHGEAPVLVSSEGTLTAPDLTVMGEGGPWHVEVKRKRRWICTPGFRPETGYNLAQHQAYLRGQRQTRVPYFVAFLHEDQAPTGLYVASLALLERHCRRWSGRTPRGRRISKPLALFPRTRLRRVARLDELELSKGGLS